MLGNHYEAPKINFYKVDENLGIRTSFLELFNYDVIVKTLLSFCAF